jgi:hypothetical protein
METKPSLASQFKESRAKAAVHGEQEREVVRADLREDPKTRASQRAAEIRGHMGGQMDDGTDEFYIPLEMVPDGWTYEWKRYMVLGREDATHQLALRRMGWDPVPRERHPEMMPPSATESWIERKGMLLMERPSEITEEVRRNENKMARAQVRTKEEQLGQAPDGHFGRNDDPRTRPQVKKSFAPITVPED